MTEEERIPFCIEELKYQWGATPASKDILVVVHDQLPYVRECLEAVMRFTKNDTIYVWDNGSQLETLTYLRNLAMDGKIVLCETPENQGFIIPNNRLCAMGTSPYIILLNSDAQPFHKGWSEAMIGYLQNHPDIGVVGYQGCKLAPNGEGGLPGQGRDIDYVAGWCLCVRREDLGKIGGLFDEEHLKFAYGEDSDLAFRFREVNLGVHALYLEHVGHRGNVTIHQVQREKGVEIRESFQANHAYIRDRWTNYLGK